MKWLHGTRLQLQTRNMKRETLNAFFTARTDWLPYMSVYAYTLNPWTKIWPAERPRKTNNTPDGQFLVYTRGSDGAFCCKRRLEIASWPVNCTHLMTFFPCQFAIFLFRKWLCQALQCPSYSTLITRSLQIHWYWKLVLVKTAWVASVQENRPYAGTV